MASIMKRGDSYSVRYKYKDHSGKPCEGWESFKTKKEAQERKITVEKELLDGTFLVPDPLRAVRPRHKAETFREAEEAVAVQHLYSRSPHAAENSILLCGGMGLDPQDSSAP